MMFSLFSFECLIAVMVAWSIIKYHWDVLLHIRSAVQLLFLDIVLYCHRHSYYLCSIVENKIEKYCSQSNFRSFTSGLFKLTMLYALLLYLLLQKFPYKIVFKILLILWYPRTYLIDQNFIFMYRQIRLLGCVVGV